MSYEPGWGRELVDVGALPMWVIKALLNCTDSGATDRTEPERYREWFAAAAAELRKAIGQGA